MKELSIEEKAKAYDRVAKEVKDFFEGRQKMYSDVERTLEYLFPELKESEDERIKKTLIDYFKTYKKQEECGINTFFGIPTDNIIAWLEKQGSEENKGNLGGISPNSAWSEEDQELMKWSIINLTELKDRFGEEYGKVGDCIDWLKSLKPQNRWKPSDEQIEILDMVLTNESMDDNIARILRELREQLKKLKG